MYNLRNPKQRARYRRVVSKRRDAHFDAADKIIRAVFNSEKNKILHVIKSGATFGAIISIPRTTKREWELAFKRIWIMVGSDSWKFSSEIWGAAQNKKPKTKPKASPMMAMYLQIKQINPEWLNYVNDYIETNGGERITGVGDTTIGRVKEALKEGIANNESTDQLAARISDVYDGFEGYRSQLIARSETVDAFNQASLAQARDAGSTLDLMWITSGDDRVRPEHEDMDGETVAYDQEFDCADGTTMPGEAENCRCTIGYAVPSG